MALEAIILQAMAKNPADRYQSAAAFRADLLRYTQGAPVLAAAPMTQAVAATRVQDRYAVVPPPTDDEETGRRTGVYVAILVVMVAVLLGLLFLLGRQLGIFDGAKHVTVPADLVGKQTAAAQSELQGLDLKSQVQTQTDPAAAGTVIATDPKGGSSVKKGSTVILLVSGGPAQVAVPNVVGQDAATASSTLTGAGFVVQTTQQNSDTVATGQVISQEPSANAQAAKGSTVTLTVSSGKAQVTIPDETGKDPATAANDLGNLSLKTKTAFEASATIPSGAVTRTDPPANSQVARGSTVTIYESTGPSQVTVPSVIGQTQAQATATLQAAGFKVSPTTGATTDSTQDGRVISQSPNAAAKAPKGATVSIVVGVFTAPPTTTAPTTTALATTTTT
jgi:serine/threonine-protein kinase